MENHMLNYETWKIYDFLLQSLAQQKIYNSFSHLFQGSLVIFMLKMDRKFLVAPYCVTLFEIFIFCPKIQLSFPEKIVDFFGGEKLVKMLWFWTF